MPLLLLVSFIWAFSYGLIKNRLAGVDSTAVATLRLGLAFLVFLPFFRPRRIPLRLAWRLIALGTVQFGVMYLLYHRSFVYLPSFAVGLFTLPMPLYVAFADAVVERRVHPRYVLAAFLALLGAAVILFNGSWQRGLLTGFLLMQASNLCFAIGQIAWRRIRPQFPAGVSDASLFALPYAGAVVACGLASLAFVDWTALHLSPSQTWSLLYLGTLSSGVCFFWWNIGATRVNAGTLAVFNNAKVPLIVLCSLVIFHETADLSRLLASGVLMALGVWVAEKK